MIVRIFRGQQPIGQLLLGLAVIFMWALSYLRGTIAGPESSMPLYNLLSSLTGQGLFAYIAGAALTLIQAIQLNVIINRHEVLIHRSHFPGLMFVLATSAVPEMLVLSPAILVNSLLIIVLDKVLRLFKNESPLPLVFDSSLLLALATLLYFPACLYLVWFLAALLVMRPFSWRDWATALMGLLTPLFFHAFYYFMTGSLAGAAAPFREQGAMLSFHPAGLWPQNYPVMAVVMGILLAISTLTLRSRYARNVARVRNFQLVIFIYAIVSLGILIATPAAQHFRYVLACVPLGVILSSYFLEAQKPWKAEILLYLFIAGIAFDFFVAP